MSKRLIINADDFGLCSSVNRGIKACFENGLVSDYSIMVNEATWPDTLKYLHGLNDGYGGFHINLTCGKSLLGKNSALTDDNGYFHSAGKLMQSLLLGRNSKEDVLLEIQSQFRLLKDAGIKITHIDTHQNVHMIPSVIQAIDLFRASENCNVFVRYPQEFSWPSPFNFTNMKRLGILNTMALSQKKRTKAKSIGGNFFNHEAPEKVAKKIKTDILKARHDLFEMAVHPGYFSQEISLYDGYTQSRETELNYLINTVKEQFHPDIEIISFREAYEKL